MSKTLERQFAYNEDYYYRQDKLPARKRIAADTERFLAAGNHISVIETGLSGFVPDRTKAVNSLGRA